MTEERLRHVVSRLKSGRRHAALVKRRAKPYEVRLKAAGAERAYLAALKLLGVYDAAGRS